MGQDGAIWQLTVASAAAMAGEHFVSLAVDGAVNALVVGLDGPALRELAGMSRSTPSEHVRDLLPGALAEAGVQPHLSVDEANLINLRTLAIHALLGWIPVRSLTSWAHATIGHQGIDVAQSIVMLDDELDLTESRANSTGDARIIIEAFLAASRKLIDRFAATPRPTGAMPAATSHGVD